MENLFIVKAVPAGIADVEQVSLDTMIAGDIIAIGDGKKVFNGSSAIADLQDVKEFMFLTRLKDGAFRTSVNIPRTQITNYNVQVATEPVVQVNGLGANVSGEGLVIPTTGKGQIFIKNLSYNHTVATQRVAYDTEKKSYETPVQFIDRVVLELNAAILLQGNQFVTVSKVGTVDLGLVFTCLDTTIDLAIGVDGIFASQPVKVLTEAVVGLGAGADVLQMEKDMSRHRGNHGYITNTDLFYSQANQTDATKNYNVATLSWNGITRTATTAKHVTNDNLVFCVDVDDTTAWTNLKALMALLVGNTYSVTGGVETGVEADDDAIDGN